MKCPQCQIEATQIGKFWICSINLDSRLFRIMSAPSAGKSAVAAQLTHTRGDMVIAAQFCEWDKLDHFS